MNRGELESEIAVVFGCITGDELQRRLIAGNIAHARQRDVAEVIEHPQLVHRGRMTTVDSPVGKLTAILPAITVPGRTPRMDPIPAVGEHTTAILSELGFGDDEQIRPEPKQAARGTGRVVLG